MKDTTAVAVLFIPVYLVLGLLTYSTNVGTIDVATEIAQLKYSLNFVYAHMNISGKENISGQYYPWQKTYYVYAKDSTPKQALDIALHENAHYIWYEYMSAYQRREYERVFNNTSTWVTEYAKTSAVEDFAETIMTAVECQLNVSAVPADRRDMIRVMDGVI